MDVDQARGGHISVANGGELVYHLSHLFLIVIDIGMEKTHTPSEGDFRECS